jgi:hypothetical protein
VIHVRGKEKAWPQSLGRLPGDWYSPSGDGLSAGVGVKQARFLFSSISLCFKFLMILP